jgi:hypothetical protein
MQGGAWPVAAVADTVTSEGEYALAYLLWIPSVNSVNDLFAFFVFQGEISNDSRRIS